MASPNSMPTNSSPRSANSTSPKWSTPTTSSSPPSTKNISRPSPDIHVQRNPSRSFPASAQRRCTPWREYQCRSRQSRLWRCPPPRRHHRQKHHYRSPLPLPRMHRFHRLRLAFNGISKGKGTARTRPPHCRFSRRAIGWASARILPRCPTRLRRLAIPAPRRAPNQTLYVESMIRANAPGSFRFTTHPSSIVMCSTTSASCAHTTLRAPSSNGAFSNS